MPCEMKPQQGTLKVVDVKKGKQLKLAFTNHNNKALELVVDAFFPGMNPDQLAGKTVLFESQGGQIQRIRVDGETEWREKRIIAPTPVNRSGRGQPGQTAPVSSSTPSSAAGAVSMFHNPYNFIPALPRGAILTDNGLEDAQPKGHDRYHPDHWSGCIRVKMTTVTPLLLPDAARMVETAEDPPEGSPRKGHKTYPVRVDGNGLPLVAATGVKGMLRSAYEAVTNSRMGVFAGHERCLQFRDGRRKVDYSLSPSKLLDDSLHPAKELSKLSPADRVFGWVADKNSDAKDCRAFKGQLRVGPVTCKTGQAKPILEKGDQGFPSDGFPLAILGQPKPEQVRFYGASDKNGAPLYTRQSKKDGYKDNQGLRGRKVYPHQPRLNSAYWVAAASGQANGNGHPVVCRRKEDQRDNQNRTVEGWVREGVTFHFDLHISNLSAVELGALLWLLKLPDAHCHRLGGGKPLGFGSVRLEIDTIDLANGQWWKAYYACLETPKEDVNDGRSHMTDAQEGDPGGVIQKFKTAVEEAFGKPFDNVFDNVHFIKAFCHAARGFGDHPTHYPRTDDQEPQADEGFQWFVANEKKSAQYPLPALYEDRVVALLKGQ